MVVLSKAAEKSRVFLELAKNLHSATKIKKGMYLVFGVFGQSPLWRACVIVKHWIFPGMCHVRMGL